MTAAIRPVPEGDTVSAGGPPPPCALVIFGATGDLTRRELIPALFELHLQRLLPEDFAVVGFSRGGWSDADFRREMRAALERYGPFDARQWDGFARCLFFVSGDFAAPAGAGGPYAALRARLADLCHERGIPDRLLFHLATPPAFFETIVGRLREAGLAGAEAGEARLDRRLIVEKPFGTDAASASALDAAVRAVFAEGQVYRIDHFLGKETVQNMLVVRFANPSFEPIWNRHYIDHVQITVAEDIGIGTRAGFYEKTGVVRDMVQNHLLQLLCMTAIEPPGRFDGVALRDETAKVLDAVQAVDVVRDAVGGQYGPGTVGGETVAGYREESGVDPASPTATYAALRLFIDNWRWAGVPFYLRTGKRMRQRLTEVAIEFKPTPHLMFAVDPARLHRNVLTFRLQPDEGILQTFAAKQPGPELSITPVTMTFSYATAFGVRQPPRAYAWLLHDAMKGDPTLFARSDWIARAWGIVDPLVAHWAERQPTGFPNYAAGSWGPAAAAALLERDGRRWRAI